MKKSLPYILIGVVIVAVIILAITDQSNERRQLDERISFRKRDKAPYGGYVAFEDLKYLFPAATVSVNDKEPGDWDSLSDNATGQALIIIAPKFYADEFEMKKLIHFAETGNDVFISAAILSEDVTSILNCTIGYVDLYDLVSARPVHTDSLEVALTKPPFHKSGNYGYPGRKLSTYFHELDSAVATVLGKDKDGRPDFIHLKAGRGNLYIHLAPIAFSNYFLLHDKNIAYYEDALSVMSRKTNTVVWDEYFLYKKYTSSGNNEGNNDQNKGWMGALFSYPALKWGLLTALFTLLVYVLLEMRRKQRYIPVITPPRNDSLDFVKTIGRLYYDKGDHRNLCRKMAGYFLEHVRNRYKLKTNDLSDDFITNLQFKTGVEETEIRAIVYFIKELEHTDAISDSQLHYFHKQLESFYNKA